MLMERKELSLEDTMMLVTPLIEFLQFASLSPSPTAIDNSFNWAFALVTFNMHRGLDTTGSEYWLLFYWVLSVAFTLVTVHVIKRTGLDKKMECISCCSFLFLFINLALPTASSWLFLPLISILLKIFMCTKATEDSFSSSFLDSDCKEACWSQSHIAYLVPCSVVLLAYITTTISFSPVWQEQQPSLNVKAQPVPILMKSVLQVVLAALRQAFFEANPAVHRWSYLICLATYFLFLLRYPLFNYSR